MTADDSLREAQTDRDTLEQFLRAAIAAADALAKLHQTGIIHQNIRPQNLRLDLRRGSVELTGAEGVHGPELSALRLPIEHLPYISPEQTGRLEDAIDHRTDLYSLGIVLYEVLIGALPFHADDALGWVHCHLARMPRPIAQMAPGVPVVVGDILLKLLAKLPDERYQSARGLQHDVERCLAALLSEGHVDPFPLGTRDAWDRLRAPTRMYGREREIDALRDALKRVTASMEPELVLVTGPSGIGKSALVGELGKHLTHAHALFISASGERNKGDIPYALIGKAFGNLVRQIAASTDAELEAVRQKLAAALGANGQILVDIVPQLELIIGEQPPPVPLPAIEARNRLNSVVRAFLEVFATEEQQLILFVDDLQWADPGSLDLLQHTLTHGAKRNVLVIGVYRDDEVTPSSALASALKQIRDAGVRVTDIHLGALSMEDLLSLLVDVFGCEAAQIQPLAELVWTRTGGNPFFATQLLGTLHQEQLIRFDARSWTWQWDIEGVAARELTEGLVALVIAKVARQPPETQEVLKRAACIGSEFSTQLLSSICGKTVEEIRSALGPALADGLLLQRPLGYRFLHDRVHQAAHALIPEQELAAAHLDVGWHLLEQTPEAELEGQLFDVVNQLNRGASRITAEKDRRRVAELDLRAARKAKGAAAPITAAGYLATGISLLPEGSWETEHALTHDLHLELAECEFLSGRLEEAGALTSVLLDRAVTNIERAAAYRLRILLATARVDNEAAIDTALTCLHDLGIDLPRRPSDGDVAAELEWVRGQLRDRAVEDLAKLPEMIDLDMVAAVEILSIIYPAAAYIDPNLAQLVIARIVRLSVLHGNTAASAHGYVTLGQFVCNKLGEVHEGYRLGKLACELVERPSFRRYQSEVFGIFGALILVWTRHVGEAIDYLRRGFQSGRELGNLLYASSNLLQLVINMLYKGEPLGVVYEATIPALEFAASAKYAFLADMVLGIQRSVEALRGNTDGLGTLSGGGFDEGAFEARLAEQNIPMMRYWYYIYKMQRRYLAHDYEGAQAAAKAAADLRWAGLPCVLEADYHAFAALTTTARYGGADEDERARLREPLRAHEEQLRRFAELCPENFAGKHALVSAEIARIDGREPEATKLYDQAIRTLHAGGFAQDEGLACELAGRFYLKRSFALMPSACIREARACYERWGAAAKVRRIEEVHPDLLERRRESAPAHEVGGEPLDTLAATRASEAISSDMDPQNLLATLMRILVEHAGAQRCCLILTSRTGLSVAAETTSDHEAVRVNTPRPGTPPSSTSLPLSLVNYVRRTREKVILDDATVQAMFSGDPYLYSERPRSLLCAPIVRRGEVAGILYLENRLVRGAFTPRRLALLEFLAAISVENALLAADLARESAERTQTEMTLRQSEERLQRLVETANVIPWEADLATGRFTYIGPQAVRMLGYPVEAWNDEQFLRANIHRDDLENALLHLRGSSGVEDFDFRIRAADSRTVWLHNVVSARGRDGAGMVGGFFFDVTERREYEATLREKLDIIEAQQASIRKLSTPIIQVWDGVLTMPVLGAVNEERAEQMMQVVLEQVTRTACRHMIIDLTGVDAVDTRTADHILKIVRAVRLLGAESIVVGIRPEVSQTIVALGLDLSSIITLANLREALLVAMRGAGRQAPGRSARRSS